MTPDITCKSFIHIRLQIQDGGQNGGHESLLLAITQPFINIDFVFFTEKCVMTPDISYKSLIQIRLQIPRWTKWRPCKGMAVSQAFISSVIADCILPYASFYAGRSCICDYDTIRIICIHIQIYSLLKLGAVMQ